MPTVLTFAGVDTKKTFLDCCVVYRGLSTTAITGLGHLEGCTVGVLADGYVHADRVVSGGAITLDAPATIVHVGLAYESLIQPMRLDVDDTVGNTQGTVKNIRGVTLRLLDTLGLQVTDLNGKTYRKVIFRNTEDAMGSAPPLFTGDKYHEIDSDYDDDATIVLKQDQPLPWTLLGLVIHYDVTGTQ